MNPRSAATQKAYDEFKASYTGDCVFCDIADRVPGDIRKESEGMRIIINAFPYATWDNNRISDHLMIVPKRHVGSMSEFTDDEAREFFQFMKKYESAGYSAYSRTPSNTQRTVTHFHTHLFKGTSL